MANPRILVAYDGSPHAADAVELGLRLADLLDGTIELAHVHHTVPVEIGGEASHAGREAFLMRRSEALLAEGAERAGRPEAPRHALAATTTATGLRELGEREAFELIVFGSAYNATPGRVHPGSAARRLLQNGPTGIAFAPAGLASTAAGELGSIAVCDDDPEQSARQTAEALSARAGVELVGEAEARLVVVGSRAGATSGRVQVSPAAERTIQRASVPVLVVPRAHALFGSQLAAA